MVLAPAWGQGSTGSDGGVVVTPDGSTVIGAEGETTVITGSSTVAHTLFKNNDTATTDQTIRLVSRQYNAAQTYGMLTASNTFTGSILNIGIGDAGQATGSPLLTKIYCGTSHAPATGLLKFHASQYGVNVGTSPAAPTSGRAWQCTTTGQTTAAYFDDAYGGKVMPWNATNNASAQIMLGAGSSNLRLYRTSTGSWIENIVGGTLNFKNTSGGGITYQTALAHSFQKSGVEVAQINANGMALPLVGAGGAPQLTIGPTGAFKIYEDATVDYVYAGTKSLYIYGAGTNVAQFRANTTKLNQPNTAGALPVVTLNQDDTDQPFIDYEGTSAASAGASISTWTAGNTIQGFVRKSINGTDQWFPYYDAPTS